MSMFGGLGGDSQSYSPEKAPKPPRRADEKTDTKTMKKYQKTAKRSSYTQTMLGGSAANPTKSYTAQLFGTGSL